MKSGGVVEVIAIMLSLVQISSFSPLPHHFFGVITFSLHQLPVIVNMPAWTDTSTKKEHQTIIFTHFGPFCQANSCKDLNALTQFKKWHKYPHLKKKKKN